MAIEIWKDIPGFNHFYQISNMGRVRSSNGIRKQFLRNNGYSFINLYKKNKNYPKSTHRLIALVFIPNPKNKPFVNHKNGVKTDNRVENLEWCTGTENMKHAVDLGLKPDITNYRKVKLNGIVYRSITALSKAIKVNRTTLNAMLSGQNPNYLGVKYI